MEIVVLLIRKVITDDDTTGHVTGNPCTPRNLHLVNSIFSFKSRSTVHELSVYTRQ